MNEDLSRKRLSHYARFFGENYTLHKTGKTSDVEVLNFLPTSGRRFHTLITNGTSNLPQPLERFKLKNAKEWTRIELLFYLPADQTNFKWVINLLGQIAHYPWNDNTFLAWHHTFTEPSARSEMRSLEHIFFLPPHFEDSQIENLEIAESLLHILWCVPINDAELEFQKQFRGVELERRLWPILQQSGPCFDSSRRTAI